MEAVTQIDSLPFSKLLTVPCACLRAATRRRSSHAEAPACGCGAVMTQRRLRHGRAAQQPVSSHIRAGRLHRSYSHDKPARVRRHLTWKRRFLNTNVQLKLLGFVLFDSYFCQNSLMKNLQQINMSLGNKRCSVNMFAEACLA